MGTVEKIGNPDSWIDHVQLYLNTANHMFIALISVYTTWLCYESAMQHGLHYWGWHVWLCTIGYQFLMCEAIMSLYQQNSWTALHTKKTKTRLHWIFQAVGSSMAIAGMIIYMVNRTEHFVSIHSQLGLASLIFTIIGMLNGVSALWAKELFRFVKPVYSKLFHNIVGTVAFILGMSSLVYGFNKFQFYIITTQNVIIALQIMCGLTIIISSIGACRSLWRLVQGAFPNFFYREDEDDDDDVPVRPRIDAKGTV